jgi:hypothetical protein
MSLVEAAIRRRADEVGRWMPSSLPAGVNKWMPFFLHREWRIGIELCTLAAGWDRSFFVDANGALLACGSEEKGETGLLGLQGDTSQTPFTAVVPTPVPSMAGVRVRAVACHDNCNLALSEAGQVFEWGRQLPLPPEERIVWRKWQPPVPTVMEELRDHRVRQLVTGVYHCAAVTEDGALFTWLVGHEEAEPNEPVSELGYGRLVRDVVGVPHRVLAFDGVRIGSVAVGAGFTVAVTAAGAVYLLGWATGALVMGMAKGVWACTTPSASRRWMVSMWRLSLRMLAMLSLSQVAEGFTRGGGTTRPTRCMVVGATATATRRRRQRRRRR